MVCYFGTSLFDIWLIVDDPIGVLESLILVLSLWRTATLNIAPASARSS
jgi:hypothetical protein